MPCQIDIQPLIKCCLSRGTLFTCYLCYIHIYVYAVLEMNCACVSIKCPHILHGLFSVLSEPLLPAPPFSHHIPHPSPTVFFVPFPLDVHVFLVFSCQTFWLGNFLMVRNEAGTSAPLAPLVDHPLRLVTLEKPSPCS